jgi:integrase
LKNLIKYQGCKNWHLRYYDDKGKRRTITLSTPDEAVAINTARAFFAGVAIKRVETVQAASSLDTLINTYLRDAKTRRRKPMRPQVAKTVGFVLKKFARETKLENASKLNASIVEGWLNRLHRAKKSQETLRSYTRDIKTFAHWLKVPLTIDLPDRGPKIRKTWVQKDVVAKVLETAKTDELRFILYAGFHAGLRRKEITMARVSWFDLAGGLLHVSNDRDFTSKDGENRTIPLTNEFHDFVKDFLRGRNPNEFVIRPKVLCTGKYRCDFSRVVHSHFASLGVDLDIHGMRRSFASNLVTAGESIYIVAQWLGDGVQVVQKHYAYLAPHSGTINRLVA